MKREKLFQQGEELLGLTDIQELKPRYDQWSYNVRRYLKESGLPQEVQKAAGIRMHFSENEFSPDDTRNAMKRAIRDTMKYLGEIQRLADEGMRPNASLALIEKILNNFYMFYKKIL